MSDSNAHRDWLRGFEADIRLLRREGIRPLALIRRIDEAVSGVKNYDTWYQFRVPTRGLSNQRMEGSTHIISVEFTNMQAARKLYDALVRLKSQFKGITHVRINTIANRYATVYVEFPQFNETA